jgi:uncharacterized membrane protein
VRAGDFVTPATLLAEVHRPSGRIGVDTEDVGEVVRLAVNVQRERDLRTDPAYGVRQLVDIALRALSPGINDPSTAVTCVGYLQALLEDLATRDLDLTPGAVHGSVVVTGEPTTFDHYLLPLTEVVTYARSDTRVLLALLTAFAGVARCSRDAARRTRVLSVREQIAATADSAERLEVERQLLRDATSST